MLRYAFIYLLGLVGGALCNGAQCTNLNNSKAGAQLVSLAPRVKVPHTLVVS